jgi:O-antigen/teichoic acid export membrane protein
MNRNEKLVLIKNAAANVARGSAAALVAVLLPPFLTRLMSSDAFGAWSLVLQLSAFVGYLDFGIQTAIGRFVAQAGERGETEHRDRIVSTSVGALTAAGAVGIAGSAGLAFLLPRIFHQVPELLLADVRMALILVAASLAVGLPFSVFNGIFVGLQRYEVPAAIIGGSRAISAVVLVLVVRHGGNLTQMGAVVALVNLASYGLQYLMYRKFAPRMRFSTHLISKEAGRELFDYCLSLSIWSFAMLLVSGLDVSLVGYFEFDKVADYAVAATLIAFLTGVQNALFNAMIPSAAVQQARQRSSQLGRVMITATRYGTSILLLMGLPLIFAAKSILTVWVGPKYAVQGARILQVLTVANIIRLSAVPYVMTLIGTGQQRLVTITPVLEGTSNLVASVIGGYFWGAKGIAAGTMFGALIGVAGNLIYNMRRTIEIKFRIVDYLRDGLLRPVVCAVPLAAVALTVHFPDSSVSIANCAAVGAGLITTACLVWWCGLVDSERKKLRSWHLAPQE